MARLLKGFAAYACVSIDLVPQQIYDMTGFSPAFSLILFVIFCDHYHHRHAHTWYHQSCHNGPSACGKSPITLPPALIALVSLYSIVWLVSLHRPRIRKWPGAYEEAWFAQGSQKHYLRTKECQRICICTVAAVRVARCCLVPQQGRKNHVSCYSRFGWIGVLLSLSLDVANIMGKKNIRLTSLPSRRHILQCFLACIQYWHLLISLLWLTNEKQKASDSPQSVGPWKNHGALLLSTSCLETVKWTAPRRDSVASTVHSSDAPLFPWKRKPAPKAVMCWAPPPPLPPNHTQPPITYLWCCSPVKSPETRARICLA